MSVEYIVRITCSCGNTVETESYANMDDDRCFPIQEFKRPIGWVSGFRDDFWDKCPECVAKLNPGDT
jgi:mRNA-degrading endonuclease toxin of MazEF toxin-antitoxin module